MAKSEHKRQQKLVKKQRRTNDLKKQRNIKLNVSNRELILAAARSPWVGCYLSGEAGMHSVFAIRQTRNGPVASVFLIDSFCLGIKDSFFIRSFDLEAFRDRKGDRETEKVTPEHALKLIQDAIAYARGIGFEPSAETDVCKLIFGNTDAAECTTEFVFGKDGKPFYMSGPHDSREKQLRIMQTLTQLGFGNFHFVLGIDSLNESDNHLDYGDDELDEEDYDVENSSEFMREAESANLEQSETVDAIDVRPAN
jgi:hypothetical protein